MSEDDERRRAAEERRAQDAKALVATISEGGEGQCFRVFAPDDLGIPTVEIRNGMRFDPIMLLPDHAEALGKALIAAAAKARIASGK